MDTKLQKELERLDPHVPFRYTSNHAHHTWAQTYHSRPDVYIRPQTLEEIQKAVTLARRCRTRLVVVGCGHSPSDLTMTSSWMMNLDAYDKIVRADVANKTVTVQGGIRLVDLNKRADEEYGLTMPNLGSIDAQSIVGAMATATHGSSLRHGLLSEAVKSLKIVLANGSCVTASPTQNRDLFRAALVSLGAVGIIVEVEWGMINSTNIKWHQSLQPLSYILDQYRSGKLWSQGEFTRCWWFPYSRRAVVWRGDKTDEPVREPKPSYVMTMISYYTYQTLLWVACFVPSIVPFAEKIMVGLQFGRKAPSDIGSAVQPLRTGLTIDCLYSQFVNEWALPLDKLPEVITRLDAWIHGNQEVAKIPYSSKGVYPQLPIEVRVSDGSKVDDSVRPYLDNMCHDGPTLYINAVIYRPYGRESPHGGAYFQAFEWLMKDLGGKPHWAKNFQTVTHDELKAMYGNDWSEWVGIRNQVDPEGMFVGDWHRRLLLGPETPSLALEEHEVAQTQMRSRGGRMWEGKIEPATPNGNGLPEKDEPVMARDVSSTSSDESFDIMQGAEASTVLSSTKEHSS